MALCGLFWPRGLPPRCGTLYSIERYAINPIGVSGFSRYGRRRWAMPESAQQLLQRVKRNINEIDIEETYSALQSAQPPLVVDVREREEFVEGAIKDAVHVPRGYLELRIENVAPDRRQPIVLYCAGGVRSALAARSLEELGYEDVSSLVGVFGAWKN